VTDGQTSCHGIVRAMHTRRAVKWCENHRLSANPTQTEMVLFTLKISMDADQSNSLAMSWSELGRHTGQ